MDDLLTSDPVEPIQDANPPGPTSPRPSPLPDADFQEYIKQYPFAAEPTYFTRPNRYYGPASTWRTWTAEDQAVVEAIDDSYARNLSVHLYNAFILKQRAGRVPGTRKVRSKSRSRHREESATDVSFMPPETWTAWPLRGSQVPRRAAHESVKSGKVLRPSSALEEALTAVTVRYAKERWSSRASAAPEVKVKREKRDWHVEHDEQETKPSINEGRNSDDGSTADNAEAISSSDDDTLPQGIQTFSSQAFLAEESSSESETPLSDDEDDVPIFSADDDHARRILKPSTRHIISKLDALLVGLHKARQAYSIRKPSSRSRSRSRAPDTDDTDTDQNTQTRGRKSKSAAEPENLSASRSQSRRRGRSKSRQYGTKGKSLGLRDWSDILGMAALTGFDPATIARASERCARLFNQNMMFRTFYEPDTTNTAQPDFEEEYALGSEVEGTPPPMVQRAPSTPDRVLHSRARSEISAYIPIRSEPLGDRVLSCPVQSCKQHEYVYTRSTRLFKHIRALHPEFDLEAFKKVMAKGGKRGRYDRSALRSRSRVKQRKVDHGSGIDSESDSGRETKHQESGDESDSE